MYELPLFMDKKKHWNNPNLEILNKIREAFTKVDGNFELFYSIYYTIWKQFSRDYGKTRHFDHKCKTLNSRTINKLVDHDRTFDFFFQLLLALEEKKMNSLSSWTQLSSWIQMLLNLQKYFQIKPEAPKSLHSSL